MDKILVFGSFIVDLMSRATHLPVPGETVKSNMFQMGAGGKGFNQAVAAQKSGGKSTVIKNNDEVANVALNALKYNMSSDFAPNGQINRNSSNYG